MSIIVSEENKKAIFSLINVKTGRLTESTVRYIDLGIHVIRLLCYSPDAVRTVEKEFGFLLKETSSIYDSTIVIWKEEPGGEFAGQVLQCLCRENKMRLRAEALWCRLKYPVINLFEQDAGGIRPFLRVDGQDGLVECIDRQNNIAFYGYRNYEPDIFVKQGHAFVRVINALVKSRDTNLAHGATFGKYGNGVLLCGRGKRGKSTLTIESMLQGFEFVSDDYQILKKSSEGLFAYPVYSIVTLGEEMFRSMKDRFKGEFLCKNFTQEKLIFDISSCREQFQTAYPIRMCLFPEIVKDEHPSIVLCNKNEKGRAMVQLIHSTVSQMDDERDRETIEKLLRMLQNLPFYKFNLCGNIRENTEYLENYLKTVNSTGAAETVLTSRLLLDITYGLATILDTETARFICMNKFATNIFQMVLSGTCREQILEELKEFEVFNPDICGEFTKFYGILQERFAALLDDDSYGRVELNSDYAQKSGYKLSVCEIMNGNNIELI